MGRPPPSPPNPRRRRWAPAPTTTAATILLPFLVAVVVVAEIAFLSRLDLTGNAAAVRHWTTSFYFPSIANPNSSSSPSDHLAGASLLDDDDGVGECVDRLEREDDVPYSRDFRINPVLVSGAEQQDWDACSVGCKFVFAPNKIPDATFDLPRHRETASILRSMESSQYYAENNIDVARRRGYNIIMTTSLSSDVPVGYFSWAEYDIMAPMHPKTEDALAAAFISNCGARNFRLQALEMLEKLNIKIDSYGIDKLQTLRRYKFSLAFENSNEEDYVTEKFFQSLVAGAVPVVVGAPNILDFGPSSRSVLHIKELSDVPSVAKTMKWKYEGPSDSFKALVDLAAVHSSCRLCIHIATRIHEKEEKTPKFQKRPCKCTDKKGTVYHLYVRERGRLNAFESAITAKFKSLNHTPIWKNERPQSVRGDDDLRIYRVYPVGLTQRQALYSFKFGSDAEFSEHVERNPCPKFEVIFV
ncbi:Glycoprotein 3-alpha-L-fucosyltransferase A [Ananas comosus]|uniref:Fucosyltransferase n=1 Tax=Ananas comosus TaxID=4615 RepID=A0A199VA57_ANACO|nr:Glycoprotein 3-alpha-L-fucosyltransferase A [Ananas comosus]